MLLTRRSILILVFLFLSRSILTGQQLAFRHLDMNNGLATNVAADVCFDKNGSLWFSSGEVFNLFDGNNLIQFHWKNYPVFPQAENGYFSADSYNRIWICYSDRTILIDEKRQPTRVIISDTIKKFFPRFCLDIKGLGIVAFTAKQTFYSNDITKPWKQLKWFDELKKDRVINWINRFDSSSLLIRIADSLFLLNFKEQKIVMKIHMPDYVEACKINENEILVGLDYKWKFHRIDIKEQKITKTYEGTSDQHGKPFSAEMLVMRQAADGNIYMTTRYSGLVRFDPVKENFFIYTHSFFSQSTVSGDNLRFLATNPDGYLAVTSRTGINITNVFQPAFRSVEFFRYPDGTIIDNGIGSLVEDRKKNLWITTMNELFIYKPGSDYVKPILHITDIDPGDGSVIMHGLSSLDGYGRIWVPFIGYGILIYNDEGKLVKELKRQSSPGTGYIPSNNIRVIRQHSNGKMLVGASNSIFIIDPATFIADTTTLKPLLDSMKLKRVVDILPDGNSIWVTTSPVGAVYKYDMVSKKVQVYSEGEIGSFRNYMLAKDKSGNVYATSFNGVSIFKPDGKIKLLGQHSGLTDMRVENALVDDSGYVWFSNTMTLVRYHPGTETFDYYDKRNGINKSGFQIGPACKTSDGKLVFGLNRGIIIVDPRDANSWQEKINFSLYKVNTDNTYEKCMGSQPLNLPYNNGRVTFSYLNSDLISGDQFFYRYKMEGIDTTWSTPTKNHLIAYNLRPGNYKFRMQASFNETKWIDFPDTVSITVASPFWQQWWFYVLIGVLAIGTTAVVIRTVQSSKEQKRKLEELNRMMNESRLMAIRSQMNPHFIFNSLNAIQECIVMQDFDTAYQYLSKFSKLLRQVLNNSEKNFIPLKDEIEVNQLYLELESLRFKKSFSYSIDVEENIDTESVKFPSLLLQPFIENAIWHGLMHKQGAKKLDISFFLENNHLECVIEDNGIGRERSAEIKRNKLGSQYFESKGTKLSGQRIQLLNDTGYTNASIKIEDLKNGTGEPEGTKVTLKLPLDYKP